MELNCNMRGVIGSRGLRLFIIQYGWLSDEARGERERESEQKRSRWRYGALCSSPACWKCDFLLSFFFFFFLPLYEQLLHWILRVSAWSCYAMNTCLL